MCRHNDRTVSAFTLSLILSYIKSVMAHNYRFIPADITIQFLPLAKDQCFMLTAFFQHDALTLHLYPQLIEIYGRSSGSARSLTEK